MSRFDFDNMPLAIVGMACRLPGADNLAEFWRLLIEGGSSIRELPPDRFNSQLYFDTKKGAPGKSYCKLGGTVSVRSLDPKQYPLTGEFSETVEPTVAVTLEVAVDACRDAGFDPFAMPACNTGVYIGRARTSPLPADLTYATRVEELAVSLRAIESFDDWTPAARERAAEQWIARVRGQYPGRSPQGRPDITFNAAARVVAESLGLHGPCLAVDAACASSAYALSVAARALHSGEIRTAIVGGSSYSSWLSVVLFSQAQALSAAGSFPFDSRADGFISSDGYGALVVKRFADAISDGDRIHALVAGIGCSCDGHGRSLWAPRSAGQVEAFRRAYSGRRAPAGLQYLEAHGTSTQLGDATEIASMTEVLRGLLPPGRRIPVASVKANIGHTVETAGIAGIVKSVLAMKHGVIPPAINFERPNPQIDFEAAPFVVPTRAMEWPSPDGPRRAGVNCFGIGGLNVHIALEEFNPSSTASIAVPALSLDASATAIACAEDDIAIVGMGAIFAGARTADAFRGLIESGTSAIRVVPTERWDPAIYYSGEPRRFRSPARLGGFVTGFNYDWRRHKIPPRQVQTADPLLYMLLDAVDSAIEDAGYGSKPFDRRRTAVVVGTTIGTDFFSDLGLALRLPEMEADLRQALETSGVVAPETAGEVVAEFRSAFERRNSTLHDKTGSFSGSALASNIARTLDLMGGAFTCDAAEASSFAALSAARDMLLAGDCDVVLCAGAQRHMSIDNYERLGLSGMLATEAAPEDGRLVPGEGVGVVMLKRLSDARSCHDRIRAIFRGVGTASDFSSPERARPVAAERAQAGARLDSAPPALLESRAAALIGHTLGASGMASLLEGVITLEKEPRALGIASQSFAGLACQVVLRSDAPVSVQAGKTEEWRIARFSAATVPELVSKVAQSTAHSLFESARQSRFHPAHPCRLAMVCDSPGSLARKIAMVSETLLVKDARPAREEHGIYFAETGRKHRVALLFPGQGSQYNGMLRDLVAACPAAAAKLHELDAIHRSLGCPTFAEIAWQPQGTLDDVWTTQVSLFTADILMHAALTDMGVRADVVAGHSYGEYPALVAAGVLTVEQAIRITHARCDLISANPATRGVLMATTADLGTVSRMVTGIDGVSIASHNAPTQTTFGGEESQVATLARRLAEEGFATRILPVPRPFHTPLMAPLQEPFHRVLAGEVFRLPGVPFMSSVSNHYLSDPLDIRDNLVEQFTRPVMYTDLVRRLVSDGFNVLIEAGPRQVLTRLHRQIFSPQDAVLLLSSDNSKRSAVEQLTHVRAALESAGVFSEPSVPASRVEPIAISAPLPASLPVVHFDATERRRTSLRNRSAAPADEPVMTTPATPASDSPRDVIETFLIDFVCENTGYPADLVDLDADLESDLGIDSLRKAQLLGELRERFDLQLPSTGNLALNDFPTLRHVLQFLKTAAPGGIPDPALIAPAGSGQTEPAVESHVPESRIVHFHGTARQIGRQHARERKAEITTILGKFRAEFATGNGSQTAGSGHLTPAGVEELAGMAEELGCPVEDLIAYNLALVGCNGHQAPAAAGQAKLAATAAGDFGGPVHAALENGTPMDLGDGPPRVLQVRHPAAGNPSLLFSLPGQLGGLHGINAKGLAITSARLANGNQSVSGSPGQIQTEVVKNVLENAHDLDSACEWIRHADRTGAWSMCISHDSSEELAYLEYNGGTLVCDRRVPPAGADPLSDDRPVVPHLRQGLHGVRALASENGSSQPSVLRPSRGELWVAPIPAAGQNDFSYKIDLDRLFLNGGSGVAAPSVAEPPKNVDRAVMSRFVLRMREAPLPQVPSTSPWHGAALIWGENPVSQALRARLIQAGVEVVNMSGSGTLEEEVGEFASLYRKTPILHCFLTQACDRIAGNWTSSPEAYQRAEHRLLLPYSLCQQWTRMLARDGLLDKASLLATTMLGGDFAFGPGLCAPEGGAMAGLLKSIGREFESLCVKVVDTPPSEHPGAVVDAVFGELAARTPQVEVGYLRGRRQLVRAVPRPAAAVSGGAIQPGSVWVVTGGARGVTAIVARELGRRYGLKLFLLGSTPLEDAALGKSLEVQRNLREMASLAVDATYIHCDVAAPAALGRALDQVRQTGGPIHGIIHGAGIESACRYENKQFDSVRATLAVKAGAAASLIALTASDPLAWFIAFGSVSGRFGGHGQTDYAMASDMLPKLMQSLRQHRPECRAVSFDWPAWDDVGMSVRPESRAILKGAGYVFMPPLEGVEHLIAEIESGAPESEVLILDDARVIDRDVIMPSAPERLAWEAAQPLLSEMPLLEGLNESSADRAVGEVRFDPVADPFLSQHQYKNSPVLPAVFGLEAIAETASTLAGTRISILRNVEIAAMFRFAAARPRIAEVTVSRIDGGVAVSLCASWFNRQGMLVEANRVFLTGVADPASAELHAPPLDVPAGEWHPMSYLTPEQAASENMVLHGPDFRGLERLILQSDEAWGGIMVRDPDAIAGNPRGRLIVPAVALDSCLVLCGVHARQVLGVYQLPKSFDSVHIGRLPAPGEACIAHARFRGRTADATCYDFVLYAESGEPLLVVEGHRSSVLPDLEVAHD